MEREKTLKAQQEAWEYKISTWKDNILSSQELKVLYDEIDNLKEMLTHSVRKVTMQNNILQFILNNELPEEKAAEFREAIK